MAIKMNIGQVSQLTNIDTMQGGEVNITHTQMNQMSDDGKAEALRKLLTSISEQLEKFEEADLNKQDKSDIIVEIKKLDTELEQKKSVEGAGLGNLLGVLNNSTGTVANVLRIAVQMGHFMGLK